jgi:predicted phage-related endonuclease
MKQEELIARWEKKLASNIAAARRESQFIGVRFGVLEELKTLETERKRIERRLEELKSKEVAT